MGNSLSAGVISPLAAPHNNFSILNIPFHFVDTYSNFNGITAECQ